MNCTHCNRETNNPKFCSKSCAAKHMNPFKKKRPVQGKCKGCRCPISTRCTYCTTCKPFKLTKDISLQMAIYHKHHRSSAYALVRSRARQIAKSLGWKSCLICGYNKHIQIGHKRAIGNFDEDTMLSVINHPNNLLPLCPNCHWEIDHGILLIPSEGVEPT